MLSFLPVHLQVSPQIRFRYAAVFSLAVLATSFMYGLAAGLRTPAAASSEQFRFLPSAEKHSKLRLLLPRAVQIGEVGQNLTLNGRDTDMLTFVSKRSVKELLTEQVERWEQNGFLAAGMVTNQRGTAFAIDRQSGKRYSFAAWKVPDDARAALSEDYPVQGIAGEITAAERQVGPEEIPDIPTVFGAKIGAVVRSDDLEGRTYTGTYTNPGSIERNVQFYEEGLSRRGWKLEQPSTKDQLTAFHQYRKDGVRLTLLFAEEPRDKSSGLETLVTVVRTEIGQGKLTRTRNAHVVAERKNEKAF